MGLPFPKKIVLAVVWALQASAPTNGQESDVGPAEACEDFTSGRYATMPWTLEECIDIWTQYSDTIPDVNHPRMPEVDIWRRTALELRRKGSPCMVASEGGGDGVGSTTMRLLATWIFAKEMGCDWITPDWGRRKVPGGDGQRVMYCHAVVSKAEIRKAKTVSELRPLRRCTKVDWLSYFQFGEPSVARPESGTTKIIRPIQGSLIGGIASVQRELEAAGFAGRTWRHLVFEVDKSWTAHRLTNLGSWDQSKRETVRDVLRQMRQNFHRHPRPWYAEDPQCRFDPKRLHFAVHVRLGDRREFAEKHPEYFQRLEDVMFTISHHVELKALATPVFHIFSETFSPCPSNDTGTFDEFPTWPVEADQLAGCSSAEARNGTFQVVDKPIMLHLGHDVENAMSCMIQADGILMGCSTFGQIAGLQSRGISMFSTQCGGDGTPQQYRMIPPLAVAERGRLWVPVLGSWYDPVLNATNVLSAALDTLLMQ